MKVSVKVYGAELPQLLGRVFTVEIETGSTLHDLIDKLERQIREKHGWAPRISSPNFNVLLNSKQAFTFKDETLYNGDIITILSPIGGG